MMIRFTPVLNFPRTLFFPAGLNLCVSISYAEQGCIHSYQSIALHQKSVFYHRTVRNELVEMKLILRLIILFVPVSNTCFTGNHWCMHMCAQRSVRELYLPPLPLITCLLLSPFIVDSSNDKF